jgi:hypothetical protein
MAFSYWQTGNFGAGFRAPANQGAQGSVRNNGWGGYGYQYYAPGSWGREDWNKWAWAGSCLRFDRGAPQPLVYWNPADTHADLTITDWLTLTHLVNDSTDRSSRANLARTIGKFYFEVTVNVQTGSIVAAGIDGGSIVLNDFVGDNGASVGWQQNGNLLNNGAVADTYASYAVGTLGIAWDGIKAYFSKITAGAHNWQGIGTDPATGTGGFTPASTITNAYPAADITKVGDSISANFGASAFAAPIPAGFVSWDGSQASTGSVFSASGSGAATLAGQSVAAGAFSAAGAAALAEAGIGIGAGAFSASGTGSLSETAQELATGSFAAAGSASLAESATVFATGAFSAAGIAALAETGRATAAATFSAAGIGSLAETGAGIEPASFTGAGSGSLSETGREVGTGVFSASGSGALAATSSGGTVTSGVFGSSGSGSLAETGRATAGGSMSAAGSGSLVEAGGAYGGGVMSSSAVGTIAETAVVYATGAAVSAGFGVLVGDGRSIARAVVSPSGSGNLNATGLGVLPVPVPPGRTVRVSKVRTLETVSAGSRTVSARGRRW